MDEIVTIEVMTGEYMQCYGYERMTDTTAAFDMALFNEARDRSNQARTEAWRELEHTNFRDFALRCHAPSTWRRYAGVCSKQGHRAQLKVMPRPPSSRR